MKHLVKTLPLTLALLPCFTAIAADSPEGAKVYFISPQNGETVRNPVTVRFGLEGMWPRPGSKWSIPGIIT